MKKILIAAFVATFILAAATSASATDVVFGLSYRLAKPAGEIADVGSDFKAHLGLKLDISKIFETHLSLKLGMVRSDIADPASAPLFGVAGELDAIFTLLNWHISDDYALKLGPMAGISFANGPAYVPDGNIDLLLGAYTRFDFLESFSIDAKLGYGFMSKGLIAQAGIEYAFTPNWFIRTDFEYMRKNGFISLSAGYRF